MDFKENILTPETTINFFAELREATEPNDFNRAQQHEYIGIRSEFCLLDAVVSLRCLGEYFNEEAFPSN
ncbi:MAG: hypothetical protein SFU25_05125 [Candidatus Caenarcaniphilales bacterium]|nr:hypothetical protein [Candidatus Caenarcaniphilales bacterium]